jgi:O-antigen ligase
VNASAGAAFPTLPAPAAVETGGASRVVRAVFLAFILLIPIETLDFFGSGAGQRVITLSRVTGLALFVLALADWRSCFRRLSPVFWLTCWYLAAYAVSQLWVPKLLDGLFLSKQLILFFNVAIFVIASNLLEDEEFRRTALRVYGWWVAIVAVAMMVGVFGQMYLGEAGRGTILGQDPNVAAGFFAMGAVCLAGDLLGARRWVLRSIPVLAAVGALVTAIIWTGSRGGLVVFVAGVVGLAVCGSRATRGRRALIAAAVILVFAGLIHREFQNGTIAAGRLMQTWTEGDTAGRGKIYEAAWGMVWERPLLGWGGAANFFTLGVQLNHPAYGVFYRDTHNLFLAILTEVGLVGAAPFAAAIFYALWLAWRFGRRSGDALPFALLCTQLAINFSLTGLNQSLFWVVLGAAVACGAAPRPDPARAEEP